MSYRHVYHPHNHPFLVDNVIYEPGPECLDPTLHALTSAQLSTQWDGPHQIQKYLKEQENRLFNTFHKPSSTQATALEYHMDGISPVPLPSRRHGTPCSQQHSSACSSDRSPIMDYDLHHPSTPPDTTTMSPFAAHHENWEIHHHRHLPQLDTIDDPGSIHPDAYVSPLELMSMHAPFNGLDSDMPLEHSLQRNLSFSSDGSTEMDLTTMAPSSQHALRQMSPDETHTTVKDEIHAFSHPSTYSDAETMGVSDEEGGSKARKRPQEDEDYNSRKRQARTTSRSGRGKQIKRSSDSRPTRHEPKRARMPEGLSINVLTPSSGSPKPAYSCESCANATFKDAAGLQKHVMQQHIRPFVCIFAYAGCPSTFASKNEWKRHVLSQHLMLYYWICTQGSCTSTNPSTSGAIFNRKDLFTQHVRRMHTPPQVRKATKQKRPTAEWDERLKTLQVEAQRVRCQLPTHMKCPSEGCIVEFHGSNAWDERMEHVARHLEKAAAGQEPPVVFGGESDPTLSDWASSSDVRVVRMVQGGSEWELCSPLQTTANASQSKRNARKGSSDEDADGEEE